MRAYIIHCFRVDADTIIFDGKCLINPKPTSCDGCVCHNLLERRRI